MVVTSIIRDKMKKFFFLMALLAVSTVTFADVVEIDDVYYNLDTKNMTATVVSHPNGYSGNVDIPRGVPYEGEEYQVTSIGDDAFRNCDKLTSVYISEGITSISPYAFYNCVSLSEVELPTSIYYIGIYSFAQAKNLKSVKFGNGIKTIGAYAFMDCVSLKTISFPNSVENIVEGAMFGCSSLESVTLSERLTKLSDYVFSSCRSLTSIKIPGSVNKIGRNVFSYCNGLKDIYCYAKQVPAADINAFYRLFLDDITLHVPEASIDEYRATEPWNSFKNVLPMTDTGISVDTVEKDIDAVYDLGGKIVSDGQKGIKIIKFTDGTTKKLIER